MGKCLHRLREVDTEKRTAICAVCGPVRIRHGGYAKKSGQIVWRCIKTANRRPGRGGKASRQRYMSKRRSSKERRRLAFKKDTCERCGFKAVHPNQIDIHHVDGDRTNDTPENWQSLCANCHRLATYAPHLF